VPGPSSTPSRPNSGGAATTAVERPPANHGCVPPIPQTRHKGTQREAEANAKSVEGFLLGMAVKVVLSVAMHATETPSGDSRLLHPHSTGRPDDSPNPQRDGMEPTTAHQATGITPPPPFLSLLHRRRKWRGLQGQRVRRLECEGEDAASHRLSTPSSVKRSSESLSRTLGRRVCRALPRGGRASR
jgi:hypothetical protein